MNVVLVMVLVVALVTLGVAAYVALRIRAMLEALRQFASRDVAVDRTVREEAERGRREAAEQARQMREDARTAREELAGQLAAFRTELAAFRTEVLKQLTAFGEQQLARFNASAQAEATRARELREEIGKFNEQLSGTLRQRIADLSEQLSTSLDSLRETVDGQLTGLRADNEKRLEQMRQTVDEKLQSTLNQRLSESFKLVSERLESVQQGLGQMQQLAGEVGNLQRVMSNVKTRGTWGEVLLGNLLEQLLTPEQYAAQVSVDGGPEKVDFAVKLPGRDSTDGPVLLPIDAKFPKEDYERLLAAQEAGDAAAVQAAGKAFENAIYAVADSIRKKYVNPPRTTDFAIMFLPSEGLYAEVLRRPALTDYLQFQCKVLPTGPTTLAALLNSLQMGFRTLAIQKRSSEVWALLGAVKTEFGKYAELMARLKKQLDTASNTIGDTERRTRVIERHLRGVEASPPETAERLLGSVMSEPATDAE